jgi:indolepyruvate ferredoxin oxidoreductase beta subunit
VKVTNIMISGVGGQGLVIATQILSEAAFEEGYDIKTSDVIGLSQRGGMVWGSVLFGQKVYSATIPDGECDLLIAMEALEGLRWAKMLKPGGRLILAVEKVYPNCVLIEKEGYPQEIPKKLNQQGYEVFPVNAQEEAKSLGNIKTSNILQLGMASKLLPFSRKTWIEVISRNVPTKTIEVNIAAFDRGRELVLVDAPAAFSHNRSLEDY